MGSHTHGTQLAFTTLQQAYVQRRPCAHASLLVNAKGSTSGELALADLQIFEPELTGPLCAEAAGFSLQAAVYCGHWEREELEKLVRYVSRPAVAEERLELLPSGDIIYKLKNRYSDATTHLKISGVEFVEKLASLVPPPRSHLTRFHGCLAPHAKMRSAIVPKKEEVAEESQNIDDGFRTEKEAEDKKRRRRSWAELLAHVFNIDVSHCENCGGEMKIVAAIMETGAIEQILTHLKIPDKPPDIAPARLLIQMNFAE